MENSNVYKSTQNYNQNSNVTNKISNFKCLQTNN